MERNKDGVSKFEFHVGGAFMNSQNFKMWICDGGAFMNSKQVSLIFPIVKRENLI